MENFSLKESWEVPYTESIQRTVGSVDLALRILQNIIDQGDLLTLRELLERIPECGEYFNDLPEDIIISATLKTGGEFLTYIPERLRHKGSVPEACLSQIPSLIAVYLEQDYSVQKISVESNPESIMYIREPLPDIRRLALEKDPHSILFFESATTEEIEYSLSKQPRLLGGITILLKEKFNEEYVLELMKNGADKDSLANYVEKFYKDPLNEIENDELKALVAFIGKI